MLSMTLKNDKNIKKTLSSNKFIESSSIHIPSIYDWRSLSYGVANPTVSLTSSDYGALRTVARSPEAYKCLFRSTSLCSTNEKELQSKSAPSQRIIIGILFKNEDLKDQKNGQPEPK
jgi:hypothetical protein